MSSITGESNRLSNEYDLRTRLHAINYLRIYKKTKQLTNYKLAEIFGLNESISSRYLRGIVTPPVSKAKAIIEVAYELLPISELIRNVVLKKEEVIDTSQLVVDHYRLSLIAYLVRTRVLTNEKITKISTIEPDGISFGILLSHELGVPLICVKRNKGLQDAYSEHYIRRNHARMSTIYLNKAQDSLLLVDDLILTGNTYSALKCLFAKIKVQLKKTVILVGNDKWQKSTEELVTLCNI
ncbi:MAG: hypothetical protein ACFFBD_05335 [Candidatus Hodarchaeota archaeon]